MGASAYGDQTFDAITRRPPAVPAVANPTAWASSSAPSLTQEQLDFYALVHQRWVRKDGGTWTTLPTALSPESLSFAVEFEVRGAFSGAEFLRSPEVYGAFAFRMVADLSEGLLDFKFPRRDIPSNLEELKLLLRQRAQEQLAMVVEDGGTWTDEATFAINWICEADLWHLWCCYHVVQSRIAEEQRDKWLEWLNGEPARMEKVVQDAMSDVLRSIITPREGAERPVSP
jgi:hypothetical protein